MWKTGHSLIEARMKETGSPLAGEMSGHIFFGGDWYGFERNGLSATSTRKAARSAQHAEPVLRRRLTEWDEWPTNLR